MKRQCLQVLQRSIELLQASQRRVDKANISDAEMVSETLRALLSVPSVADTLLTEALNTFSKE